MSCFLMIGACSRLMCASVICTSLMWQAGLTNHLCSYVLPPHGALQPAGVPLEAERLRLEVVGRLHEQFDALSSLQNLQDH